MKKLLYMSQDNQSSVRKKSIRNRLLSYLIFLAIMPLLVFGTILLWQSFIMQKEQIKELQFALTEQVADKVSLFLEEQEHKISTLIKSEYLPDMSREQLERVLLKFLATSKEEVYGRVFNEIALLDMAGKEVVRKSRYRLILKKELSVRSDKQEYLYPLQKGKRYYGTVYFDQATGEPAMTVGVPIKDPLTLNVRGVLIAEMNFMAMRKLVADTKINKRGTVFLLDQENRVFAHPNHSIILKKTKFDAPQQPRVMVGVQGEKAVVAAKHIDLNGRPLLVVTEIPASEAFQNVPYSMALIGAGILFALGSSLMLGVAIVRQIVRPVEGLAHIAKKISDGDYSQEADSAREDEFGELAAAFNSMTNKLLKTIHDLKKEKDFVHNIIEALSHPFYVIDAHDYTIKMANTAAGFTGSASDKKCHMLTHNSDKPCCGPDHPCIIKEIKKTGKPVLQEHVHCLGGGTPKQYEVYGYPLYDDDGNLAQVIEYNIDITERKYLEDQLRQTQKLEAIGSLAGGVAHDFNNILTAILGYSEILMMRIPEEDPLWSNVEDIHTAGNRAAALTKQLLAFSRKQVMEMKIINLDTLIRNMTNMLDRLIGERIEMKLLLRSEGGNIKADPSQVEQIIMNMTVNARDAMPDGGKLIFETDIVELDEAYCRNHAEVSAGSYVVLSISDTGEGLAPGIKEKIFDPFFTTKAKGAGTGLGLSTVYGIMKQLQGYIYVYSEPGRGTTFKIYFPEKQGVIPDKISASQYEKIVSSESETLLVVDDDTTILKVVSSTLSPLGYKVFKADTGEKAIDIYNANGGNIDLLLTDVIMQGMNGKELYDKIKAIKKDQKVLFMSGYTDNVIAHQGVLEPGLFFINKPLVPSKLTQKIRQILDG